MMDLAQTALASGFTPGAYGIWLLVLLAFGMVIKAWPMLRKSQLEADGSLRADLLNRIAKLEQHVADLEMQMHKEREAHAVEMAAERAARNAEVQLMRHRLNNETMTFDALLMLLEAAPEKVGENIVRIKEMRAQRAHEIAVEKGAMAKTEGKP